jgi:phosphoribosylformylglycinamidine synthase
VIDELTAVPPGVAFTPGHHVVTLGATRIELAGSEWAFTVHGLDGGPAPSADLRAARFLHGLVRDVVNDRLVASVHDASDGGLAVTLAEMAIAGGCGFAITPEPGIPIAAWCFGESTSRVVVGVEPQRLDELLLRARDAGVPARDCGMTGGSRVVIDGVCDLTLDAATAAWRDAIPSRVGADLSPGS